MVERPRILPKGFSTAECLVGAEWPRSASPRWKSLVVMRARVSVQVALGALQVSSVLINSSLKWYNTLKPQFDDLLLLLAVLSRLGASIWSHALASLRMASLALTCRTGGGSDF